jgi:hypothetical protein
MTADPYSQGSKHKRLSAEIEESRNKKCGSPDVKPKENPISRNNE